jgi:hypothetical protein
LVTLGCRFLQTPATALHWLLFAVLGVLGGAGTRADPRLTHASPSVLALFGTCSSSQSSPGYAVFDEFPTAGRLRWRSIVLSGA